jgi:hypothetical protein
MKELALDMPTDEALELEEVAIGIRSKLGEVHA